MVRYKVREGKEELSQGSRQQTVNGRSHWQTWLGVHTEVKTFYIESMAIQRSFATTFGLLSMRSRYIVSLIVSTALLKETQVRLFLAHSEIAHSCTHGPQKACFNHCGTTGITAIGSCEINAKAWRLVGHG